ncbi:6-bladed beta-propeller [Bacteroides sp. AN502(2024)]|uniref:6-bladed beta-propeller n=1 Tax=Bacteroides sp. AN502(2024) TaxID=3160599 RepID=UPI0035182F0D
MKKYVLIAFIGISLLSCGHRVKTEKNIKVIKTVQAHEADWSKMTHIDSMIPLEMTESSLLSIAQKCLVSKERILFCDSKLKQVLAFNRQGRFLFSVGNKGGAANEYVELRDVIFSKDESQIEILDPTGILIYSALDGHFLEKKKVPNFNLNDCFRFTSIKDSVYLFFKSKDEYSIYEWNAGQLRGLRKRKNEQLVCNHFYVYGDNNLIFPDYGHFVLDEYNDGKLIPKYYIDFGKDFSLPEDMLPQTFDEFNKIDNMNEYFKSITEVVESEDVLYIRAVGPSRKYYDIYWDKLKNKIFAGWADMGMGLVLIQGDGSHFYGLLYPDYVSEQSVFYPLVEKYLHKDSNPLFVKFRIDEK